jgi:hypothetical protein
MIADCELTPMHQRPAPMQEQDRANARLIAACPDLLAALKLAQEAFADLADVAGDVQEWNCGGIGYTASQAVKQAIAQAEGRN